MCWQRSSSSFLPPPKVCRLPLGQIVALHALSLFVVDLFDLATFFAACLTDEPWADIPHHRLDEDPRRLSHVTTKRMYFCVLYVLRIICTVP